MNSTMQWWDQQGNKHPTSSTSSSRRRSTKAKGNTTASQRVSVSLSTIVICGFGLLGSIHISVLAYQQHFFLVADPNQNVAGVNRYARGGDSGCIEGCRWRTVVVTGRIGSKSCWNEY